MSTLCFRAVHLWSDYPGWMLMQNVNRFMEMWVKRSKTSKLYHWTECRKRTSLCMCVCCWLVRHIMPCQCEEGQMDEVGVDSHRQQQHCQLQQRVQTQEDCACYHSNHTAQNKDLRGQGEWKRDTVEKCFSYDFILSCIQCFWWQILFQLLLSTPRGKCRRWVDVRLPLVSPVHQPLLCLWECTIPCQKTNKSHKPFENY